MGGTQLLSYYEFCRRALGSRPHVGQSLAERWLLSLSYHGDNRGTGEAPAGRVIPTTSYRFSAWAYGKQKNWADADREIDGRILARLCNDETLRDSVSRRGITAVGGLLNDELNLDYADSGLRLALMFCRFEQGFSARDASFARLCLRGCKLKVLPKATPSGPDPLPESISSNGVALMLQGVKVRGDVDLDTELEPNSEGSLNNWTPRDQPANHKQNWKQAGHGFDHTNGLFIAQGVVRADGIAVGGRLTARHAAFRPDKDDVQRHGASFRLGHARIGLDLSLHHARFLNAAADLRGIRVRGNVGLDHAGLHVDFEHDGDPYRDPKRSGRALDLREAKIDGDLTLDLAKEIHGTVDFSRSRIGGKASFCESVFLKRSFPGDPGDLEGVNERRRLEVRAYSLMGDKAEVGHDLRIIKTDLDGGISIDDMRIGGYLKLIGSKINRKACNNKTPAPHGHGSASPVDSVGFWPLTRALHADRIEVGDDVAIGEPKRGLPDATKMSETAKTFFYGQVNFRWAKIGGFLNLTSAQVTAVDGKINAVTVSGGTVGGNVLMGPASRFRGSVRFVGSTIKGNVEIEGSRFDRLYDHDALSMRGATIHGDLRLGLVGQDPTDATGPADWRMRASGTVSFADATIVGRVNVAAALTSTTPLDRLEAVAADDRARETQAKPDQTSRPGKIARGIHNLRRERRRLPSALSFRNATLKSDVRFHRGCEVRGRISFSNATLGSHLIFLGGDYRIRTRKDRDGWSRDDSDGLNDHFAAINADDALLPDKQYLNDADNTADAEHDDAIRVLSAEIDGRVYFGMDEASQLSRVNRVRIVGRVSFNAAVIQGWLSLGNIEITGIRYPSPQDPSGGSYHRWTLTASGATIRSGLYVRGLAADRPARFVGEFRVRRATIYHEVDLDNAEFISIRPPGDGEPKDRVSANCLIRPVGTDPGDVDELEDWLRPPERSGRAVAPVDRSGRDRGFTEHDWLSRIAPSRPRPQDWALINFTRTTVIGIVRFREGVKFRAPILIPHIREARNSEHSSGAGSRGRDEWQRKAADPRPLRRHTRLPRGDETRSKAALYQCRAFKKQRRWDICWVRLDEMTIRGRLEWGPEVESAEDREWSAWGLLMDETQVGTFNHRTDSAPGYGRLSISDFRYEHIFIQKPLNRGAAASELKPDNRLSHVETQGKSIQISYDADDYLAWLDRQHTVCRRSLDFEVVPRSILQSVGSVFGHLRIYAVVLLVCLTAAALAALYATYGFWEPPDPLSRAGLALHGSWPLTVLTFLALFFSVLFLTMLSTGLGIFVSKRLEEVRYFDWLGFDTQPYEQLAKVYREGGDEEQYRRVVVAKSRRYCQTQRRRTLRMIYQWLNRSGCRVSPRQEAAGRLKRFVEKSKAWGRELLWVPLCLIFAYGKGRVLYRLWGVASRYGTSSLPAIAGLLFLWLVGGVVFGKNGRLDGVPGAVSSIVAPSDPRTYLVAPDEYPHYSSWIFSADNVLPIIELGSTNHWVINRSAGREFYDQLEYQADRLYPEYMPTLDGGGSEGNPDGSGVDQGPMRLRQDANEAVRRRGILAELLPTQLAKDTWNSWAGWNSQNKRPIWRLWGVGEWVFGRATTSDPPQADGAANGLVRDADGDGTSGAAASITQRLREHQRLQAERSGRPLDDLRPDHDRSGRVYVPPGQEPPTMLNFSWRDYDEPTLTARWLSVFQKLQIALGWALTTIAVLGYTGLIRRD